MKFFFKGIPSPILHASRGIWLFLILLLLFGCANKPTSISVGRDDVGLELWASNTCLSANENLKVRATVTNYRSEPLRVQIPEHPVIDLSIYYRVPDGERTINWSDGKPLDLEVTTLELKPGETKSIELAWQIIPDANTVTVSANLILDPQFANRPVNALLSLNKGMCPGFGP